MIAAVDVAQGLMERLQARNQPVVSAPPATLPDVCDWAEDKFFVVETGRPIVLLSHQKEILRLFSEQTGAGVFRWQTLIYSTVKKSGKTTISGLYARWAAETWGAFREVYNMGNKLKQAKERAFKIAKRSILMGPKSLRDEWDLLETKMVHLPTGSFIEALPISASGEAGGNQSLTVWTELWGFQYEDALRMWDELKPVPTNPLSQRFVDTYAGFEGESELLWQLWQMGLKGERLHDSLPVFGVPEAGLIAYIDTGVEARRMPWQTPHYYAQQEKIETPQSYQRHHLNEWTTSQIALVDMAVWDMQTPPPPLPVTHGGVRVVAAVDASVSGDCTAVSVCTLLSTGPSPLVGEGEDHQWYVVELETHIFEPEGNKLDYAVTLRPCLDNILKRFRVMRIVYDPYQLHDFMTQLKKEVRVTIEEFSQAGERLKADTALVNAVRQGTLWHQGNEKLRRHIQNADGKASGDKAIRIVKRATNKPVDGAVALSMAAWTARQVLDQPGRPAVVQVRHNLYGRKRRR